MQLISRLFWRGGGIPSNCLELWENAKDLMADDCEEILAGRLQAHVRDCPDCSPWYRAFRATVGLLRELPGRRAPKNTVARTRKNTYG